MLVRWWLLMFEWEKMQQIQNSMLAVSLVGVREGRCKGLNYFCLVKNLSVNKHKSFFQVVAVLVRDVKYHQLSKVQQRTLILYCEQDIHNYSRQAIAFSLLKAILGRKLQLPELNAVMEKVARISITADIDNVRLQARQVSYSRIIVTNSA